MTAAVRGELERNAAALARLEGAAEAALAQAPERAVRLVRAAADFCWHNHPGAFASPRLERVLVGAAAHVPAVTGAPAPTGTVLHVLTEAYDTGGHTALVCRWIELDEARPVVALTGGTPPAGRLVEAVRRAGGSVEVLDGDGPLAVAGSLRRLARGAASVVTHLHPFDPTAVLAFGGVTDRAPVALVDHADNVFWVGVAGADLVLSLRPGARDLVVRRRGVPAERTAILPLPLADPAGPRPDAGAVLRRRLGLGPHQRLLVSVGTPYKYGTDGVDDFQSLLSRVLTARPEACVAVAGPAPDDARFADVLSRFAGRVHLLGPVRATGELLAAADVYLDSYATQGITTVLEAAAAGVPALSFRPPDRLPPPLDGDAPGLEETLVGRTVDEYVVLLSRLLDDERHRRRTAERARERARASSGPEPWRAAMVEALKPRRAGAATVPAAIGETEPLDEARMAQFAFAGLREPLIATVERAGVADPPAVEVVWSFGADPLPGIDATATASHRLDGAPGPDRVRADPGDDASAALRHVLHRIRSPFVLVVGADAAPSPATVAALLDLLGSTAGADAAVPVDEHGVPWTVGGAGDGCALVRTAAAVGRRPLKSCTATGVVCPHRHSDGPDASTGETVAERLRVVVALPATPAEAEGLLAAVVGDLPDDVYDAVLIDTSGGALDGLLARVDGATVCSRAGRLGLDRFTGIDVPEGPVLLVDERRRPLPGWWSGARRPAEGEVAGLRLDGTGGPVLADRRILECFPAGSWAALAERLVETGWRLVDERIDDGAVAREVATARELVAGDRSDSAVAHYLRALNGGAGPEVRAELGLARILCLRSRSGLELLDASPELPSIELPGELRATDLRRLGLAELGRLEAARPAELEGLLRRPLRALAGAGPMAVREPAGTVLMRPPRWLDQDAEPDVAVARPTSGLVSVERGSVLGCSSVVLAGEGRGRAAFLDLAEHPSRDRMNLFDQVVVGRIGDELLLREPPPATCVDRAVTVLTSCSANWFHFVVEVLPRLLCVLDAPQLAGTPLLVDDAAWRIGSMRRLVERVVDGRHPIVPVPAGAVVEVAELTVPLTGTVLAPGIRSDLDLRVEDYCLPSEWLDRVSAVLRAEGAGSSRPLPRRVVLDRSGTQHARLANHADVVAALGRLGFEAVAPERLDLADQVRLFAECDVLVGATGAAFTNLLAGHGELVAFSLQARVSGAVWRFPLFSTLAASRGVSLGYVATRPLEARSHRWDPIHYVDPDRLVEIVADRVGTPAPPRTVFA